jgi:hypothetical protein
LDNNAVVNSPAPDLLLGLNAFSKKTKRTSTILDLDSPVERLARFGREHWSGLHSKQDPNPEWFAGWLARIPRFGCTCRKDFQAIIEANPPRYDDFFAWSVEAHNAVNQKLNKPIMSLEDAAKIWRTFDLR